MFVCMRERVCPLSCTLEGIFLVYDLSTKSKQAKQKGRQREGDGETPRKICDRGDGDEGRMRREKKAEKQNAGQASKDYCMKVV